MVCIPSAKCICNTIYSFFIIICFCRTCCFISVLCYSFFPFISCSFWFPNIISCCISIFSFNFYCTVNMICFVIWNLVWMKNNWFNFIFFNIANFRFKLIINCFPMSVAFRNYITRACTTIRPFNNSASYIIKCVLVITIPYSTFQRNFTFTKRSTPLIRTIRFWVTRWSF